MPMARKGHNQMKADKKETLMKLRTAQSIYLVFSKCSRMPFVACDPETFDDQVLLYFDKEAAEEGVKKLTGAGEQVQLIEMKNQMFLPFYTGLFPMGVNALLVDEGTEGEIRIQLDELVRRPDVPEGKARVENPQMHLTALYFVQEHRKPGRGTEMTGKLQELNEEMLAHFQKGRYLVAVHEKEGIPVLKQKDGRVYQPVFTDIAEFRKFDKEKKFRVSVVEAAKLPDIILEGVSGVAVNPLGVNVVLNIRRSQAKSQERKLEEIIQEEIVKGDQEQEDGHEKTV